MDNCLTLLSDIIILNEFFWGCASHTARVSKGTAAHTHTHTNPRMNPAVFTMSSRYTELRDAVGMLADRFRQRPPAFNVLWHHLSPAQQNSHKKARAHTDRREKTLTFHPSHALRFVNSLPPADAWFPLTSCHVHPYVLFSLSASDDVYLRGLKCSHTDSLFLDGTSRSSAVLHFGKAAAVPANLEILALISSVVCLLFWVHAS